MTRIDDAAHAIAWRYPAVHLDRGDRVHVAWMDDRAGFGAIYHAYSDNAGQLLAEQPSKRSTVLVPCTDAPVPPPATQRDWVGDYLLLTTVGDAVIVGWSDQRAGTPKSVVQIAAGRFSVPER